ncbi:MAG: protein kinase [bacterium]|nr:protein kinase [bacterium]
MNLDRCPRCHADLRPTERPHGLCPKCLVAVAMGAPEVLRSVSGTPAPEPPRPEELGGYFPKLAILEVLGRGGMGIVYRARHRELDRPVALKLLPIDAQNDPAFAERFQREARAMASLDHPNIAAVYDSGRAGPYFFLVLELVDGPNLRQLLRSRDVPAAQALRIVSQISAALESAHAQGVVHRDIKPENVLITPEGDAKIVDFGLAKLLGRAGEEAGLTHTRQAMGTWHYMAPEQVEHPQDVDHRADIYSLGVVLYELLTGELPLGRFDAPSQRVEIDVRLDDVVLRALEKDPERRYQRVGEVRDRVEAISRTRATHDHGADKGRTEKARSRHTGSSPRRSSSARGCLFPLLLSLVLTAFALIVTRQLRSAASATGQLLSSAHEVAVSTPAVPSREPMSWAGDWKLSERDVGLPGSAPDVMRLVNRYRKRYLQAESRNTRVLVTEPHRLQLVVNMFGQERAELRAELQREIAHLPDGALRLSEVDMHAVFPRGGNFYVLHMDLSSQGYVAREAWGSPEPNPAGRPTAIYEGKRVAWRDPEVYVELPVRLAAFERFLR